MNWVADEHVSREIISRLRSIGHHVVAIAESASSATDPVVLSLANVNEAILLTEDKDFGELVFRLGKASHGVVLLRLGVLSEQSKAELLTEAVEMHGSEMSCEFTVIEPYQCRIRSIVEGRERSGEGRKRRRRAERGVDPASRRSPPRKPWAFRNSAHKKLAPPTGLEPVTPRLTAACSTN